MANHVLIVNGQVVQSDRTGKPPKGFVAAPEEVVPGFLHDGTKFEAPPIPERAATPNPLELLKARVDELEAALKAKGVI